MREIHVSAITDSVKKLCMEANYSLEPDMLRAFDNALKTERSAAGRHVLEILKDNAQLARTKRIPYCQDTGFVVCFAELGQDVRVTGGLLTDAINEGVRQGYTEGYLRASIVRSPFDRVNTGDNTPAVIHLDLVARRHAQAPDHGQGRRLREPLEVQDADAGRGRRGRQGVDSRVHQDGGARRVPATDRRGRRRRHFREGGHPLQARAVPRARRAESRRRRWTPSSARCSTAPTASASAPRATAETPRPSASTSSRIPATSRASPSPSRSSATRIATRKRCCDRHAPPRRLQGSHPAAQRR